MSTLYVLQLEDGKYYVGKTDNVQKRFEQHKSGFGGSQWTKLYKPIKIEKTQQITSIHDENNITKDYMKKYGIENVRGGSYTQVELEDYQYECLKYEIRCISDCCFKCGRTDHFAKDCKEEVAYGEDMVWVCDKCSLEFETQQDCEEHEKTCKKSKPICSRCGRFGHSLATCFARSHINGTYLH